MGVATPFLTSAAVYADGGVGREALPYAGLMVLLLVAIKLAAEAFLLVFALLHLTLLALLAWCIVKRRFYKRTLLVVSIALSIGYACVLAAWVFLAPPPGATYYTLSLPHRMESKPRAGAGMPVA